MQLVSSKCTESTSFETKHLVEFDSVNVLVLSHCSSDSVLSAGRCFPADWILSGVASPTCDPSKEQHNDCHRYHNVSLQNKVKTKSLTSSSVSSMLWSSGLLATSSSSIIRLRVSSCVTNGCWRNKLQFLTPKTNRDLLMKEGQRQELDHRERQPKCINKQIDATCLFPFTVDAVASHQRWNWGAVGTKQDLDFLTLRIRDYKNPFSSNQWVFWQR